MVENKCSKQKECLNPDTRWIRPRKPCLEITISPSQFDLDTSQALVRGTFCHHLALCKPLAFLCIQLTLTLSRSLPSLLTGEIYLCHFASGGVTFTVNAVGERMMYTCNVTDMIPPEYSGLSTGTMILGHTRIVAIRVL